MNNKNFYEQRTISQRLTAIRDDSDPQSNFWAVANSASNNDSSWITDLFGPSEIGVLGITVSIDGFSSIAAQGHAVVMLA
jgi:hypothetical protein